MCVQAIEQGQGVVAGARNRGIPSRSEWNIDTGRIVSFRRQRRAPCVAAHYLQVASMLHVPPLELRVQDGGVAAALVEQLDRVVALPAGNIAQAHARVHLYPRVIVVQARRVDPQLVREVRAVVRPYAAANVEIYPTTSGCQEPAPVTATLAKSPGRSRTAGHSPRCDP